MSTIVTRAGKGSALTWTEGDQNLINLNTDKIENVADDLTPQLGGDLDVNGKKIVSTANGNIVLDTDGTGQIHIPFANDGVKIYEQNFGSEGSPFWVNILSSYNGNGNFFMLGKEFGFQASNGGYVNLIATETGITAQAPTITLGVQNQTAGTDVKLTTEGQQDLVINTNGGTNSGAITVLQGANANILVEPNGSGKIKLDNHLWPNSDGSANQVLKTDGAGNLSWTTIAGGTDTTYSISAETATGGVNLRLTGSDSSTDDVKFAAGSNITLTRTDANTITIDAAGGTPSVALNDLTDVTLTSSTLGDVLVKSSGDWINIAQSSLSVGYATSAGSATAAGTVTLTSDNTTNATRYPLFADAATGDKSPRTDTGFTYNPSTGVLTATSFSGSFSGSLSGAHNGTVGATTPNTGAFTTLSASSTVNFSPSNANLNFTPAGTGTITLAPATTTGAINNMAIGQSNAQAGSFTTLSASSTVSGTGFSTYLASPPAIGGTTAAAGTFTTLTSTGRLVMKDLTETVYSIGTTSGTVAPNVANGTVQKITLNGNLTLNAFTSPVAGQSLTLIITQDATGNRTLTSTMKFSGGTKTLSTAANSIDIITVFYDGTNYWASLGKDFK